MTKFNGYPGVVEFTTVNTDGNGEAVVTLSKTPDASYAVAVYTGTSMRTAEVKTLSTNQLTVIIRKVGTRFYGIDTVDAASLPSGVTVAVADPITTSSFTGSAGMDRHINAGYTNLTPAQTGAVTHAHTIQQIFQHKHSLAAGTYTELGSGSADLKATSESSIKLCVIYAIQEG